MCGAPGDRRLEVCTQTDYLRAAVADLWKGVYPYFREDGRAYEFSIDFGKVKRFCFDDSAVARVEIATTRLRELTESTASKALSTAGGDKLGDNSKKIGKRKPRGPYKAERNAEIVRRVHKKVREGSSKEQAIEETADELRAKSTTIRRAYYRALKERRHSPRHCRSIQ
jgi:hypothetical protein